MKVSIGKLGGLLNSTHPIPSFTVALFATLFSLGLSQPLERSLVIGLAVLLQQFSVGLSNDWLDYQRDLISERKDKPSVRGIVSAKEIRNGSIFSGVFSLVISFSLGLEAGFLMILMLGVGWSYNLGMKSNWSSFIPYAVGFGLLPVFAGVASLVPLLVPFWIAAVTALFGISAHFANALPDMFDDKATGVNALPHLLGQRLSAFVISLTALSATALILTQSNSLPPSVAAIGLVLTIVFVGLASLLALKARPPRIVFPLLLLGSAVNLILLIIGMSG